MPEMTQLERALRILQRVSTHDRVTVRELFDAFDGTETHRTIQRTLELIQSANIPLQVQRGPHNELAYSMRHTFDFTTMQLTPDEAIAAALLSQFRSVFQGSSIGEAIDKVFDKMRQIAPEDCIVLPSPFGGAEGMMAYHEPGLVNLDGRGTILRDLFDAIVHTRKCRVRYKDKSYTVHPYSLVLHMGAMYAIVYHPGHDHHVFLSLPRIKSLKVLDATFVRDAGFRMNDFLKDNFGIWHEEPQDVVIRFSATVRRSLEDRIWHHSQRFEPQPDGGILLHMHAGVSAELVAWVLRWGEFAEALEPAGLRSEVKRRITAMRSIYATARRA